MNSVNSLSSTQAVLEDDVVFEFVFPGDRFEAAAVDFAPCAQLVRMRCAQHDVHDSRAATA